MASGTLETVRNPEAPAPPARAVVTEALDRVLSSDSFKGAVRVQQFLRHIVLRTLDGDLASLKENRIASEVFDRGDGFDSAADSIVRTQASLLRKRLAEYYASAGRSDSIRIDLPRGAYIAHFTTVHIPTEPPPARPVPPPWVLLAAGLILGIAATALYFRIQSPTPNSAALPVWSTFIDPAQVTTIALGTPYFTSGGNGLYLRDVSVNDETEMQARAKVPEWPLSNSLIRRPSRLYTGVGEAIGLERVSNLFVRNRWPLRIVRADLLRWQDLKDENVIVLGSYRFRSVAGELDPYTHFAFDTKALSGRIFNLKPRPGEAKEYVAPDDDQRGQSYALITLLPGKTQNRRVLFLQGVNTWGTQAAAEFVSSAEHLEALRRKISGPLPKYFQVLIHAEVRHEQPHGIDIVTYRDLTPADQK
ncbi:MAG: hypothetical protein HYX27_15585 [Acidobacteria bacterium]|nr:hypothetical protein [Acidobacteriota bacterium]